MRAAFPPQLVHGQAEKAVEAVKTAAAKTNTRKGGKGKRRK